MNKEEKEKLSEILGDYNWYYEESITNFIDRLLQAEREKCAMRGDSLKKKKHTSCLVHEPDICGLCADNEIVAPYNDAITDFAKAIRED